MKSHEPIELSSPSNAKVRHLMRMRDNRARRKAGKVIVDGWRETCQAFGGGLRLCGLYRLSAEEDGVELSDQSRQLIAAAAERGCLHHVTPPVMQKISYGQSARGVVAEFEAPSTELASLRLPDEPTLLVLDRIEKPGNLGAVFRCADAAGIDAIVLSDAACDRFNPNAIRASLGAVFRVPSAGGTAAEVGELLQSRQIRPLAARVESSLPLWQCDFSGPVAIILGSEAEGLATRWQTLDQQPIAGVRIPMFGEIDSLNLSVSAAVIAYEAARRRPVQP